MELMRIFGSSMILSQTNYSKKKKICDALCPIQFSFVQFNCIKFIKGVKTDIHSLLLLRPTILPESVRWLISRGRYKEALAILKRVAKVNGVQLDDNITVITDRETPDEGMRVILKTLFTSKTLVLRLLILTGDW